MQVNEFLSLVKDKYPIKSGRAAGDAHLYDMGMRYFQRDGADFLDEVEPFHVLEEVQEEAGNTFLTNVMTPQTAKAPWTELVTEPLGEWLGGETGARIQNIGRTGYNDSILGIGDKLSTGELPYELKTIIDPKTGERKEVPSSWLDEVASFVMGMVMPADLLTFWAGGKVFSTGYNVFSRLSGANKAVGKGLQYGIKKNLFKGFLKTEPTSKLAKIAAEKESWRLLRNPGQLVSARKSPVTHTFRGNGKQFTKEIFNGEKMGELWLRNAHHLGGSLFAHRLFGEGLNVMYQNALEEQSKNPDIDWKSIKKAPTMDQIKGTILPNAAYSYASGMVVGGVKAIAGMPLFDSFNARAVKAGEYAAESIAFGVTEPLLRGEEVTGEHIKHSFINLGGIKLAYGAVGKANRIFHEANRAIRNRRDKGKVELDQIEDMLLNVDNENVALSLKKSRDDKKIELDLSKEFGADDLKTYEWFEGHLKDLAVEAEKKGLEKSGANKVLLSHFQGGLKESDIVKLKSVKENAIEDFISRNDKKVSEGGSAVEYTDDVKTMMANAKMIDEFIAYYEKSGFVNENVQEYKYTETGQDLINRALKKGFDAPELGQYTTQLTNDKNQPLFRHKKTGAETTKDNKNTVPILEPKNDEAFFIIRTLINKKQQEENKALGIGDYQLDIDALGRVEDRGRSGEEFLSDATASGYVSDIYQRDFNHSVEFYKKGDKRIPNPNFWKSQLAGTNKNLIALSMHQNSKAWGKKITNETRAKNLGIITNFAKYLESKFGVSLLGDGATRAEMSEYVRLFFDEGKGWNPNTKEGKSYGEDVNAMNFALRKLYGDAANPRLEKYIPGIGNITEGTYDAPPKKVQVRFPDVRTAVPAISEFLNRGANPNKIIDNKSKVYGITNREWDLFFRLGLATRGRVQELVGRYTSGEGRIGKPIAKLENFIGGEVYSYWESKVAGSKNESFQKDLSPFTEKLYDDLQAWGYVNSKGPKGNLDSPLFPNLTKYFDKEKSILTGVVDILSSLPEETRYQTMLVLTANEKMGSVKANSPLYITENIVESNGLKYKISSMFRNVPKNWPTTKIKEVLNKKDSKGFSHKWYMVESEKTLAKLMKDKKSTVESRFLIKQKADITPEGFDYIKKGFEKRNPGAKFGETLLPKGVGAQTQFQLTRDLINYQLGKTSMKHIWHENQERLYKYSIESGDKTLQNMFKEGFASVKKQALFEWNARGKAKGTGYKDFKLFNREWFFEKSAKVSQGLFVEESTKLGLERWMQKSMSPLSKWWLGFDNTKDFVIEDYVTFFGRGGYEGLNTLETIRFRDKDGGVVYDKFNSDNKQDVIVTSRKSILNQLEQAARDTKKTPREIFDELDWKNRFLGLKGKKINSFSDINDANLASALLHDIKFNVNWDKIENNRYKEELLSWSNKANSTSNWEVEGPAGLVKGGELQKFIHIPGTVFRKFLGKNGIELDEKFLLPVVLKRERYEGKLALLFQRQSEIVKENMSDSKILRLGLSKRLHHLVTNKDFNYVRSKLDLISVYEGIGAKEGESVAIKTGLNKEQLEFRNNLIKQNNAIKSGKLKKEDINPKEHMEYMLVAEQEKFYKDTWKQFSKSIDKAVKVGLFDKVDGESMKNDLQKKEVKNYLTHTISPEFREFQEKTKEGRDLRLYLAERELRKELVSSDETKQDKIYKSIFGKMRKEQLKKEGKDEALIEELKVQLDERFEKIALKKVTKNKEEMTVIEKMADDMLDQIQYNPEVLINLNVEVKRHPYDEFYDVKDLELKKKYGDRIRVFDTTHDGTVIAYGNRAASFSAALEHTPEFVKFAREHMPAKFRKTPIADLIKGGVKTLDSQSQKKLTDFVNTTFKLELGIDKVVPEGRIGRGLMGFSKLSASAGLSGFMSGIKNRFLGETSIFALKGLKYNIKAWKHFNDPEFNRLARIASGSITSRRLKEQGLISIPLTEGKGKLPSFSEMISKPGFMSPTEWGNRKRDVIASYFWAEDAFAVERGEKTKFFKAEQETFRDKIANEYHVNKREYEVGKKYGLDPNKIPKTIKNYEEILDIQNELKFKIAQYGHKIGQGATGVTDLPLWFNRSLTGKWATVFHRIAWSMTRNYKRGVLDPMLKHNNFLPIIRYASGHLAAGAALWQLKSFFLGQDNPHGAFNNDEDRKMAFLKIADYGYASEMGAYFSGIFSPYRSIGEDSSLAEVLGIVNYRNAQSIVGNALSYGLGKKWMGQAIEDVLKDIFVVYNHGQKIFYRATNPFLTNQKKVRRILSNWAKRNDPRKTYSGAGGGLNERSPWYRKLRHGFMTGKADGPHGYVATYWAAHDDILVNELEAGIPRDLALKSARSALQSSVARYAPLFYSENSEKGRIMLKKFDKSLTVEDRYLIRKHKDEYDKKLEVFWLDVNRFNRKRKITEY